MKILRQPQSDFRLRKMRVGSGRVWLGIIFALAFWSFSCAQQPVILPPGGAAQMMIPQPAVEISSAESITATAVFEPGLVSVGAKAFYRVTVEATENSIAWPEKISAPPALDFGLNVRGQVSRLEGNKFRPLTSFVYEVTARTNGHFVVPALTVGVDGRPVTIPAAAVDVVMENFEPPVLRRLVLQNLPTNLFVGQPFRLRVMLPVGPGNDLEALREVQFNGGRLMFDKLSTRQLVENVNLNGQTKAAYVYETIATPFAPGAANIFAQAFTSGRDFGGPIVINGQVTIASGAPKYQLITSEPQTIQVRPLPAGELSGFTGAMGKFTASLLKISARRVKVGEPLYLKYDFVSGTNLIRFVPPEAPRVRGWQIIAGKLGENTFTLIPLTDEVTNTPVIPFSAFDPAAGKFYDLSISALPVEVTGEGLPVQLSVWDSAQKKDAPVKLSALAEAPGKTVERLKPLSWAGWFGFVLLPLGLAFMVWRWDERRRFLAAHPEIVRCLEAKRALRYERKELRRAVAAGDAEGFIQHAAAALRVAVAPHFPAESRAMVGADVLAQLDAAERAGDAGALVRRIFGSEDKRFSAKPDKPADLLAMHAELETLLEKLEAKL